MKSTLKIIAIFFIISIFYFCNKKVDDIDTILTGKVTILVDESIKPIIDDEVMIFESEYKAKINLSPKSENEVLQALVNDSSQIAVMADKLSVKDSLFFARNKKIIPRQTPIATDALALIANKRDNDTLIDLQEVVDFMNGKSTSKIKGLVFDNLNSSTIRYMLAKAKLKNIPEKGIFSFKTNEETIKYVSENAGMIGIVGVNWLASPTAAVEKLKENINILSVKDIGGKDYFYPSQYNLGEAKYPLARDLYIINCQGYSGLGMGFASFIGGERGQRIILKSGLLPMKIPTRKIRARKNINNDKE
jgi:phosphate transport system substrate-binding protein